ncbi:TSUP family transporter [Photobacterium sp. Hal280]|uniref:TSUP family transporter n=1 Tax=Photobacterium sp. Hal280 TaxID=3035163 RepID=UPI00301D43B1
MLESIAFVPSDSVFIMLFCAAFIAGIVDAIAGGGGLITVPSLLLAGVPPLTALGTNRLQAVIGELTSFVTYLWHKEVKLAGLLLGMIATAIGATAGSFAVSLFPADILRALLPILMVAITAYSILSKRLKNVVAQQAKVSSRTFMLSMGLIIGFYNGFFGPGTGAIWMIAFAILLGYTIKQASIATKPLNLMGNLVSLIFFISISSVNYQIGLVMGVAQVLGSVLGSKVVIRNGDRVVRPIFITVTLLMTMKLIYETGTGPVLAFVTGH